MGRDPDQFAVKSGRNTLILADMNSCWRQKYVTTQRLGSSSRTTSSRGIFPATASALAVGLILFPALRRRKVLLGACASLLLAYALVSSLPSSYQAYGGTERGVERTAVDPTSGRTGLWLETIHAIAERPLFGYGEGQLSSVTSNEVLHPHNVLVQVPLAWGVVDSVCILVLGLYLAKHVIVTVRANSGEWLPPCMALMVLVAYSAHDGSLFFPFSVSLAASCAALAAAPPRLRHGSRV